MSTSTNRFRSTLSGCQCVAIIVRQTGQFNFITFYILSKSVEITCKHVQAMALRHMFIYLLNSRNTTLVVRHCQTPNFPLVLNLNQLLSRLEPSRTLPSHSECGSQKRQQSQERSYSLLPHALFINFYTSPTTLTQSYLNRAL